MPFIGIHNHTDVSNFRLKDSINKTSSLIDYSIELGHAGIAITDHETIAAHIKAIKYVKKLKEKGKLPEGYKLILGNEIYLCDRETVEKRKENNERIDFYHLILLAKDEIGHKCLRELSAEAWTHSFFFKGLERVPTYKDYFLNLIQKYKGHLIASTACLGGELGKLSLDYLKNGSIETKRQIHTFITMMKFLFEDDFYLEIQPSSENSDQIEYNKFLLKLSKAYNLKVVVSTDSHYLKKEHRNFHRCFLNSKDGDREVDDFYATTYLMSEGEMYDFLKDYISKDEFEEMMLNTIEIGNKVKNYDLYQEVSIPKADISEFKLNHLFHLYYEKYDYIKKFAFSEHETDRYFLYTIEEGFKKKNQEFNEENLSRIDIELKEIYLISEELKQQLSGYYIVTKEMMDICWEVSILGPSRGSASGFYILFLTEVVALNPIKHNLPHWRHLSIERGAELPDVDWDTEGSKRDLIIQKVKERYGFDKVINICTFKQEKAKSSVQTAMRGLGFDADTISNVSKLATHPTLSDCLYGNEEEGLKPLTDFIEEIKKHDNLEEAILMFEGLISGRSQHASGVIKYDKGILEHNSIMTTTGGKLVTQFDYDDSVYSGGMKFDFLSLTSLDKIHDTMDLLIKHNKIEDKGSIKDTFNFYLSPDVIEWGNKEVYDLLYQGELPDAFQFDTSQGRKAIQKIQPHSFNELAAGNSLMRLSVNGAEQPIDKFVKYKKDISLAYDEMRECGLNDEEIKVIESHLKDTYFIASSQEDAMELSMNPKIAGFTLGEANKLRKAIAKANAKELIKQIKDRFYSKGTKLGNRKEILDYVWEKQIKPMLGYSFSRNHVLPYTCILLQELNLAYRFGSLFWKTAVLTRKIGDVGSVATGVGAMREMIKNPDINLSEPGFVPYEEENKILYGLLSINKIGKDIVEEIINNRPYNSIDDVFVKLLDENKISLLNLFTLAKAGCFDSLYENKSRQEIMIDLVERITPRKEKLTMSNMTKLVNVIPDSYKKEKNIYWFRNVYLKQCKKDSEKFYVPLNGLEFVNKNIQIDYNIGEFIEINIKEFEKYYKKEIKPLQNWLLEEETLNLYHRACCRDNWSTYCKGNKKSWEMETIFMYTEGHEVDDYDVDKFFKLENFFELEEEPILESIEITKRGR